jgi:hypothetical protein
MRTHYELNGLAYVGSLTERVISERRSRRSTGRNQQHEGEDWSSENPAVHPGGSAAAAASICLQDA